MTAEVVTTTQGQGTLALRGNQADWTEMQQAALAQIGVADAPRGDQLVLLHVAQRTGLDPFARQIYMIGRKDDKEPSGKKWTIQTGIDGFRIISERHPQYGGVTDAEWCGEDGAWRDVWLDDTKPPVAARIGVIRRDFDNPVRAVARYKEYVQTKYGGGPNHMWATMPAHMLAKCAEALARRKAFPQDLGNVYTDDEMAHLDNPPPVVIPSERIQTAASAAEPDWNGLIARHKADRNVQALWDLRKLAQGLRPNDAPLLNRIAQAWQDTKAAAAAADASTQPPSKGQMNRLFALLAEAGIKDDERRHRLATHVLDRDVTTFTDLTANDLSTLITRLERLKAEGRLGAAQASQDTPADQPGPAETEGDQ